MADQTLALAFVRRRLIGLVIRNARSQCTVNDHGQSVRDGDQCRFASAVTQPVKTFFQVTVFSSLLPPRRTLPASFVPNDFLA